MNLTDKKILITSGPTRAYIDSVRYITNSSTGRLGSLIADYALKNKASVTFIYGKDSEIPRCRGLIYQARLLRLIEFTTVSDLFSVVCKELKKKYDIIIHLASVLDYVPDKTYKGKIKSDKGKLIIRFARTPKIVKYIRLLSPNSFLVSFKLEVGISKHELIDRAYSSLVKNKSDLVVANDLNRIKGDKHFALIIDKNKKIIATCHTKSEIAKKIIELILIIKQHLGR